MSHFIKKATFISSNYAFIPTKTFKKFYSKRLPIIEFYEKTTGEVIAESSLLSLKKKHPNIEKLQNEDIKIILQILNKFNITPLEACKHLHVFNMHPLTIDNYGEIFRECGFINVLPQHIIKYHTIVKRKPVSMLKKEGLMPYEIDVEQVLLNKFDEWPQNKKENLGFPESSTPLITIRKSVLERYLKWKLGISSDEFKKYCRNYLPLRHKPMSDIQESINLAENKIELSQETIRRNGFLISQDPVNTKLIIENVPSLAGLDIKEVIKVEPAILKNNYVSLLQIRDILEEYRIPIEFQRRCFRVFCMKPETVKSRLDEVTQLKEYSILSSNPRMLSLIVHRNKFMNRLNKIQEAKKQCYSFNHLVASSQIFNNYISSFGSKVCGRDISVLINSSLKLNNGNQNSRQVVNQLKKHKYWLHVSLSCIDENIQYLKRYFDDHIILNNCHILLYPTLEIIHYTNMLLKSRNRESETSYRLDTTYTNLKQELLTDDQILSLTLYEIEKKYHFTGDGIWARQEPSKTEAP